MEHMNQRICGMSLLVVIILSLSMMTNCYQHDIDQQSIWIVYTDTPDTNMALAAQTFTNEMVSSGCCIKTTTIDKFDVIPKYSDLITIIGHGQKDGVIFSDKILPWDILYKMIGERNPLHTVVLACHSPSVPESGIFGFMGEIDAEAGALIATWFTSEVLGLKMIDDTIYSRTIEAQMALLHPLSRYVYFVHGYFGDPTDFSTMKSNLMERELLNYYDGFRDFSYFDAYGASTSEEKDLLHWCTTVSDYALNFANYLIAHHESGTQVNIVAHSLGGIITREMLALYRSNLESEGIDIGTVVTLGTPHHGTFLANLVNLAAVVASLLPLYPNLYLWPSPVFYSVFPLSPLIINLNSNPMSYSEGIRWYTAAGVDVLWGIVTSGIHYELSDVIVGESRAKLSFAIESPTFVGLHHSALIKYVNGTFASVASWLCTDYDSDGDGLGDDMETYMYGTDNNDWDSDDDNLSDGHEYLYYNTNPLNPDTDNDNLGDADEFTYNTDPLDSDSDNDGILDGDEVYTYESNPLSIDSDSDTLSDGDEVFIYGTDPSDTDSDNDGLLDPDEINIYETDPAAWSTDGDILSDSQEIAWGYDPNDTDNPIDAEYLTYSVWQVSGTTGKVRANHYSAMDYVKVYVKYKNSLGYWTAYFYAGTDSTPTYYGDYYVEWSLLQGYVEMQLNVQAYDSAGHYLGSDQQYVTLPGGGGGGGGGGDPVPE